jgi:hypothetical protein
VVEVHVDPTGLEPDTVGTAVFLGAVLAVVATVVRAPAFLVPALLVAVISTVRYLPTSALVET